MIGSYGKINLKTFTEVARSDYYPIAEADVALGIPSVQDIGKKLADYQITGLYWEINQQDIDLWYEYASPTIGSKESKLLIINNQPKGNFIITAITSNQGKLPNSERLNITLKAEGAFLWKGIYSPYAPPPVARRQAEQGLGGLLDGLSGWLKK